MTNSPYETAIGCRECGYPCDEVRSSDDTHQLRDLCERCSTCETCGLTEGTRGALVHHVVTECLTERGKLLRFHEYICDECLAEPDVQRVILEIFLENLNGGRS